MRQLYAFLAVEVSNRFVTLASKNKLREDIFFNQFNVHGALRARQKLLFFDLSAQRLAARFARGKKTPFFDFSKAPKPALGTIEFGVSAKIPVLWWYETSVRPPERL